MSNKPLHAISESDMQYTLARMYKFPPATLTIQGRLDLLITFTLLLSIESNISERDSGLLLQRLK
jgi:hypothetical protein